MTSRIARAAVVVGDLQRRLSAVERWIEPTAAMSNTQAAEISSKVKALAELLTSRDPSKNHYQSIFAELYRRFEVSSYKLIRQDQYQAILAFLDDWRRTLYGLRDGGGSMSQSPTQKATSCAKRFSQCIAVLLDLGAYTLVVCLRRMTFQM